MSSQPTLLIARRDFVERFRSRAFRTTTVVSAIAIAALIAGPTLVGGHHKQMLKVATTAVLRDQVASDLAGFDPVVQAVTAPDVARRLRRGDADVGVVSETEIVVAGDAPNALVSAAVAQLREALTVRSALAADGIHNDPSAIRPASVHQIRREGTVPEERRAAGFAVTLAVFFLLQQYGSWLLNAVAEEKASRVVEVVLSRATARELLAGKLLGIGALAAGQAALLSAVAAASFLATGSRARVHVVLPAVGVGVAAFLLGLALYATIFAAVGSLVERHQDVQGAQFPVQLPLLAGYAAGLGNSVGTGTALAKVASFFPLTSPVTLPGLVLSHQAGLAHIAASAALMLLSIVAVTLIAARIYEHSVLKTGRRITLGEALRSTLGRRGNNVGSVAEAKPGPRTA